MYARSSKIASSKDPWSSFNNPGVFVLDKTISTNMRPGAELRTKNVPALFDSPRATSRRTTCASACPDKTLVTEKLIKEL